MPAISKIRYTNVVYENGGKRYIDNIFKFEGYNGILLLENGGGKTVFVQTLLQAVLPHSKVAGRRITDTLVLNNNIAHIAVEWILNDNPRRYALTAVSLFMNSKEQVASYRFANEYGPESKDRIDKIPFIKEQAGKKRAAGKEEIAEYYRLAASGSMVAKFFGESDTLASYGAYLETAFKIIPSEWAKIATINMSEGGVEEYFAKCDTTGALVDRLLIPTVEEALAAGGACDFVDLFEKQRVHFQKQIQLSARIQELSQVIEDLSSYNKKLKEYYDLEQLLEKQKMELKSLHRYVGQRREEKKSQQARSELRLQGLQAEQAENERAAGSLAVAVKAAAKEDAKAAKDLADQERAAAKVVLMEKQSRDDNLRYARAREGCKLQKEAISLAKAQLERLDKDMAIADIQDKLAENAAALKGYFVDTTHRIRQEITAVGRQLKQAKEERQQLQRQQEECRAKREGCRQKISGNEGQITQIVDIMTKIEEEILADNINATVESEAPKWQERAEALTAEAESFARQVDEYQKERESCRLKIPELQQEKHDLELQQNDNKNKLQSVESEASHLMAEMRLLPAFSMMKEDIHAFYQREATWLKLLEESVELLRRQKEEALADERRACRSLDDYQGKAFFTADAALAENLPKWQEPFALFESGTAYFQHARRFLDEAAAKAAAAYPYWAASVVVTAAELEKAARFLAARANCLTQAVYLLTEQEAREICEGKAYPSDMRQILPARWENIEPDKFAAWLGALQLEAAAVSEKKRGIEADFQEQSSRLKKVRAFYQRHTYQEYQTLLAEREEITDRIDVAGKRLENLLTAEERLEKALANQQQRLAAAREEQNKLAGSMQKAKEYFAYKKNHQVLLAGNQELREKINVLDSGLQNLAIRLAQAEGLIDQLTYDDVETNSRLTQLEGKEFYQEVQEFSPQSSPYAYETLADQRRALRAELEGRQKDRGLLIEKQKSAQERQDALRREMEEIEAKAEWPLDKTLAFTEGGEAELVRLRGELKQSKDHLFRLESAYAEKNDAYQSSKGAYDNQLAAYRERYGDLLTFTENLSDVKEKLRQEKQRLLAASQEQKQALKELQETIKILDDMAYLLLCKNEVLHFTADTVAETVLDVQIEAKPFQDLRVLIREKLTAAEELLQAVLAKQAENQQQKESFMNECRRKIFDERMKQAVLTGIGNKAAYREFAEWHASIRERVAYSIRIAEGERKEHYTHIEQIIGQIHTYLADVAEELKQIPKKTRIKIEEGSKDFYVIHVPEWKESDGKDIIRHYFDSITKRLEQPEFRDEYGMEKTKEIRAALEKSLRTQQLFNQVIGEHAIRVKCRKVTNNNQLSIGTYTWEESCRWSGGEKWSKNMALFLGCLNYLSEKGKNVKMTKNCNRAVVADNPFGQASSEHVLNPVFFIAKQLGFQFIALTAHDEGGFIRKYFPVVYSCRFAQSKDQKSQVIQTEKEIKTAFFQENNPTALNRLADYENIGLF